MTTFGDVPNGAFMEHAREKAAKGLLMAVSGVLLPGTRIYRFATSLKRERFFSGEWWFGQTPFDSMKAYAQASGCSLRDAARECLAVDHSWSQMDFLLSATLVLRLSAWMGTPLTQSIKTPALILARGELQGGRYVRQLEPDRSITQYYIPGLGEQVLKDWVTGRTEVIRPGWRPATEIERGRSQVLWQVAFTARHEQPLAILKL